MSCVSWGPHHLLPLMHCHHNTSVFASSESSSCGSTRGRALPYRVSWSFRALQNGVPSVQIEGATHRRGFGLIPALNGWASSSCRGSCLCIVLVTVCSCGCSCSSSSSSSFRSLLWTLEGVFLMDMSRDREADEIMSSCWLDREAAHHGVCVCVCVRVCVCVCC